MSQKMPSTQEALGLFDQLYAERFFSKAAELGIQIPQTAKAQQAMMQTAYNLDLLPEEGSKTASDGDDFHVQANTKLAQLMKQHGFDVDPEASVKQAEAEEHHELALSVVTNPDVYKAAMVLNHAASQQQAED